MICCKRLVTDWIVWYGYIFPQVTVQPRGLATLDRGLCCLTAQSACANSCSGQDCSKSCSARCGILNTLCGTWTCQSKSFAAQDNLYKVAALLCYIKPSVVWSCRD